MRFQITKSSGFCRATSFLASDDGSHEGRVRQFAMRLVLFSAPGLLIATRPVSQVLRQRSRDAVEFYEVSNRACRNGDGGNSAIEQVVAPYRVVGHLVDRSAVLASVIFRRYVRVRSDQIAVIALVIDCEPRLLFGTHVVVHERLRKAVAAHAKRRAGRRERWSPLGRPSRQRGPQRLSGFNGAWHGSGSIRETSEAGGCCERQLESIARLSDRCYSIGAAQLESKPCQCGKRQLRGHLDEAEFGRAGEHVLGNAHERAARERAGAHATRRLAASAASRFGWNDDMEGKCQPSEFRRVVRLSQLAFGDFASGTLPIMLRAGLFSCILCAIRLASFPMTASPRTQC